MKNTSSPTTEFIKKVLAIEFAEETKLIESIKKVLGQGLPEEKSLLLFSLTFKGFELAPSRCVSLDDQESLKFALMKMEEAGIHNFLIVEVERARGVSTAVWNGPDQLASFHIVGRTAVMDKWELKQPLSTVAVV